MKIFEFQIKFNWNVYLGDVIGDTSKFVQYMTWTNADQDPGCYVRH